MESNETRRERRLEDVVAVVRAQKHQLSEFEEPLQDYVRWHREHPHLAKPRVMFLHQDAVDEEHT